ncbi:hypothetical protein N0V90_013466 [Kalmusia sp. IMI 367209]|nr:hypothetical protein N0V90_013466 [Kalmusia sp. IMI 367209]
MRPLRLLLSLATSLIAITLLLFLAFGSQNAELRSSAVPVKANSGFKALFSFTSPGSLFPPSAIISLTDDNSTFFLARPAAFGPKLPSDSLSGPLWIGSDFGDEVMGIGGELGCSDVPGWDDGFDEVLSATPDSEETSPDLSEHRENPLTKQPHGAVGVTERSFGNDDGTDDHLQARQPIGQTGKYRIGKTPEHADIESLQESAEIAGKIVLLKRGGCGFLEKVKWAQKRGGVALIVGDNVRGGALVQMYARGDTSNITIPALFTSHTTAHLLSSLLPTGGLLQNLSREDVAKLGLMKSGKRSTSHGKQGDVSRTSSGRSSNSEQSRASRETGWFDSFLSNLGFKTTNRVSSKDANRRPPSSGKLNWVAAEAYQTRTNSAIAKATATATLDDFIIGEQDWRDPGLLASPSTSQTLLKQSPMPENRVKGGSVTPSSGEYAETHTGKSKGWLNQFLDEKQDQSSEADEEENSATSSTSKHFEDDKPASPHEGLWVTLTPTNMSASPLFDTLLVLVVSPLVTLTVVYALLLLRSRIRRRRWRAPKSLVDRLPVRTYHTISDSSSSATPNASSPTTPLLQHEPPQPVSSPSRPRSRTESEVPATSSSVQQGHRTPEEEKRESGLAAWRRRYGGRQKECVVCLEEYVDGISRVMSLPCGHEFHADCITPWLVTRRRTCPICKGDVVRSLSQSYHDRAVSRLEADRLDDEVDDFQAQAAETRNDSPSASRPVPISSDHIDDDIEANWADDGDERGREIPRERTGDVSSSFRDVSSSAVTAIWRGFEAVGRATGLQRRLSREELDRDR